MKTLFANKKAVLLILASLVVFLFSQFTFEMNEYEKGILIRLGTPVATIEKAGLNFKIPFIDSVEKFPKMMISFKSEPDEIITREQKTLIVNDFSLWKVGNPLLFFKRVQNTANAESRIDDITYSVIREKIAKYNLSEVISTKRDEITDTAAKESAKKLAEYGIILQDTQIMKTNLPTQNENSVYARMVTERQQEAKKYRGEGQELYMKVRAEADKESTIIKAEAYKKSQELKGDGESTALKIYANAYNRDKDFYRFIKKLETYEKTINENDTLVLSTGTEVFDLLTGK